jgi:quercetin dioxygenase-like cupin family protein
MIIANEKDILASAFSGPEAKGAAMKVLISAKEGWKDYVMRVVELAPGGHSPHHAHDWPHINYMLEGSGVLKLDDRETPVSAGSYAYVPAGQAHQYRNTGQTTFRFICIVPTEGHIA